MSLIRRTAILALATTCSMASATEIIAHRGASHDAPENTLAAFRLAWEQGADAGELDIHQTKDGQIVVIHDATTKRNLGVDKPVAEQTLAELRKLDAGAWKGAEWKGERLPTLAEVLATMPKGKRMFIEIKCSAAVLPELDRVVRASGKALGQFAIIVFDFATAKAAKERFPDLHVHWLAAYKPDKRTGAMPDIDALIARAKAAGFDGLDLEFKFPIDAQVAAKAKAAGLKLFVWTVNDAAAARRLAQAGVDGITTDRPAWLRAQLGNPAR
jgi:glycerophosphoryl diester phosphodiesterase